MKVKRYVARTSREALRQVKDELGNDAVILSNRKTRDGVEIMALAEAEMSNLVQPQMTASDRERNVDSNAAPSTALYAKTSSLQQDD